MLSDSDHDALTRTLLIPYANGASRTQGMREFVQTSTGTVNHSYRKAGINIFLAVESDCRILTALTVFAGSKKRTFDMSLAGDILTIGPGQMHLARPDAVPALLKILYRLIETTARDDA